MRNNTIRYDFKYKEDYETIGFGDLRGRIVHSVLDREIKKSEVRDEVLNVLASEMTNKYLDVDKEKFADEIESLVNKYYNSSIFKELESAEKYFNEYEIYTAENDFYLYGIVDKLIFEQDRIIIVDYKTDKTSATTFWEKGDEYLTQLMFYANILSKENKSINNYELKIVFIQEPECEYKKKCNT